MEMNAPKMSYQAAQGIVFTQLSDTESVLLNLTTKKYYSLNETGTLFWTLMQQSKTVQDIANSFSETYKITPDQARIKVDGFAQELVSEKLIQEA